MPFFPICNKKKGGEGMKRFFYETEKRTKMIGVTGVAAGVGATHFSIALANYVANVLQQKVVYISFEEKSEVSNMILSKQQEYEFMNVCYCSCATAIRISELWNEGYDYMILDFGKDFPTYRAEFLRCEKKVVLGSLILWKKAYFDQRMETLKKEMHYETWDYYALFGIKEDKKEFKIDYGISIRTFPYIEDPFQIKKETYAFFQEALSFDEIKTTTRSGFHRIIRR